MRKIIKGYTLSIVARFWCPACHSRVASRRDNFCDVCGMSLAGYKTRAFAQYL